MSIDQEQIRHLGRLTRIAVKDAELTQVAAKLNGVVAMVDIIQGQDTAGVEPLCHPLENTQRLRADEVTEPEQRDRLQRGAPATEAGFFLVPRAVE